MVPIRIRNLGSMKQVSSRSFPWLKLPRSRFTIDASSFALWVSTLVVLETVGRHLHNDLQDAFLLVALTGWVAGTAAWHQHANIRWVGWLVKTARHAGASLASHRVEFGVDLRREPPIRRRIPRAFLLPMGALTLTVVALVVGRGWFPEQARAVVTRGSYTLWLIALSTIWAACIAMSVVVLFYTHASLHDWCLRRQRSRQGRPPAREAPFHLGVTAFWMAGMGFLPDWLAFSVLLGVGLLFTGLLCVPFRPEVVLLWRPKNSPAEPLGAMTLRIFYGTQLWLPVLIICVLALLTRGDRLTAPAVAPSLWVTPFVGNLVLWTGLVGFLTICVSFGAGLRLGHRLSPSRPVVPGVRIEGVARRSTKKELRRLASRHGLRVRFGDPGEATDVPFRWVEEGNSSPGMTWPRELARGDWEDPELIPAIHRRFDRQCRRLLYRRLKRLFKFVGEREFHQGEGFWVGLHLWYVTGLSRDTNEEQTDFQHEPVIDQTLGPPYHQLFPRPVRHHFFQVMEALEVDLIFVEDGVKFRRFRRVLEAMFETYDMFGGEQPIEEKHFVGIPGLRVVLHDHPGTSPFGKDAEDYPEPNYEDIGRARVLHVFVDRGDAFEPEEIPVDFRGVPVLSGI